MSALSLRHAGVLLLGVLLGALEPAVGAEDPFVEFQEAFIKHDAFQCGFCTSGMLMSGAALLEREKNPSDEQIRAAVAGNLCRCGTYPHVFNACREAAR